MHSMTEYYTPIDISFKIVFKKLSLRRKNMDPEQLEKVIASAMSQMVQQQQLQQQSPHVTAALKIELKDLKLDKEESLGFTDELSMPESQNIKGLRRGIQDK